MRGRVLVVKRSLRGLRVIVVVLGMRLPIDLLLLVQDRSDHYEEKLYMNGRIGEVWWFRGIAFETIHVCLACFPCFDTQFSSTSNGESRRWICHILIR